MHPQTFYGHLIAMIEIFVGLMSLALITGLMFARFSRPQARFLFYAQWRGSRHRRQTDIDVSCGNERQNVVQEPQTVGACCVTR